MSEATDFSIVVPSVGRPSLRTLLVALNRCDGPRPNAVVVVDDRVAATTPAVEPVGGWVEDVLTVRHGSGGTGPAAARNIGWRGCTTTWVAFLDDDVVVGEDWLDALAADLTAAVKAAGPVVAASEARIVVPLPEGRRPTDWERGTAGLATAKWITADMAYRRDVLLEVGGFDERFPRAFREDADLALRVRRRGYRVVQGERVTTHPVRPAPWDASLRQQRGNADDVLMTRLHGRDWYERAHASRGRRRLHVLTTAALLTAAGGVLTRRPRIAASGAAAWLAATGEFALARIAPGPRDRREIGRMLATSALIPPAATWHWVHGQLEHRTARPLPVAQRPDLTGVRAVLFDRDGTLVHDVPFNGRPELVRPVAGAREALDRLRAASVKLGVVSNQSGVARGLLTLDDVRAVNARVDELLGPFDTWQFCPHGPDDGCACRKPGPAMITAAAAELAVPVASCVVVGDTAADVGAAEAAGALGGVLVPNEVTRGQEVLAARWRLVDLAAVADAVLAGAERQGALR